MLSKNYNLRVIFRGTECATNGRTIVLPELGLLERKNMTDVELKECHEFLLSVMGYVNHESGHILFTDMKYMGQMHQETGEKKTYLLNALEDLRIEKKLSDVYKGARQSLDHLNTWSDQKISEQIGAGEKLTEFQELIYGVVLVGNNRNPENSKTWKLLSKGMRDLVMKFQDEIRQVRKASTTSEVRDVTNKLWDEMKKYLKDKKAKQPPTPKQETKSGNKGSKGSKGKGQKGDQEGAQGSASEEDEEDQHQDGQEGGEEGEEKGPSAKGKDSSGSGGGSDGKVRRRSGSNSGAGSDGEDDDDFGAPDLSNPDEDEEDGGEGRDQKSAEDDAEGSEDGNTARHSEDDPEGEEDADEEAESESGEGVDKASRAGESDQEEGGEEETESDSGAESGVDQSDENGTTPSTLFDETKRVDKKDAPKSRQDGIQQFMDKNITNKVVAEFEGEYLIYSTENDSREFVPMDKATDRPRLALIDESVRSIYGPLRRVLEAKLRARALSYRVGDLEEGDIDRSTLHRLPLGMGKNVFSAEVLGQSLRDTCGALVYDCSGSMGFRLEELRRTLFVFGEVFNMMKVPFMSWGFTTGDYEGHSLYNKVSERDRKIYTRFGAVHLHVLKEFHERWEQVKERIVNINAHSNAYDGECLRIAAQELINQPQKRKVLWVFSDGSPQGNEPNSQKRLAEYLKRAARELTDNRLVELVGVGIGTDSVKDYYPRWFVVDKMEELPTLMLSELNRVFLG